MKKSVIITILALLAANLQAFSARALEANHLSHSVKTTQGDTPQWLIKMIDAEVKLIWQQIEAGTHAGKYQKTFTNTETGDEADVEFEWMPDASKADKFSINIKRI